MEGTVKTINLFNLKESMDKSMKESMEENMEKLTKLIQNAEEKIPKDIDMGQGSQENKDMVKVDKPSITKPNIGGYDSNNGSNQAGSSKGTNSPISI
jgi:hypothetical protein